jgi:hypothetical protein
MKSRTKLEISKTKGTEFFFEKYKDQSELLCKLYKYPIFYIFHFDPSSFNPVID